MRPDFYHHEARDEAKRLLLGLLEALGAGTTPSLIVTDETRDEVGRIIDLTVIAACQEIWAVLVPMYDRQVSDFRQKYPDWEPSDVSELSREERPPPTGA